MSADLGRRSVKRVTPLETHAEWRAADVADPTSWTLRLAAAHLDELDAALAHSHVVSDEILDITADDFPLPTLGPLLREFVRELIDGRGFGRIGTIDVERLGPDNASRIYWGIGMHLGEPWPQNAKGHLLGNVRDEGKRPGDPTARGNEIGGSPLTFHSDGSDLVGLMCLDAGSSGGESLVTNALFAHNELARTEPELATELYGSLPYDFRGEHRRGATPFYFVPTFTRHVGSDCERLFIRYIRPFIEASQRHPDAPRLTERQRTAMDAYDALINAPENRVEMLLQPGEMQFVNNYHVLHGRRGYVDDVDVGRVRWLKRLWLATDTLAEDQRPERFQPTGALSHWSTKRTKA